MGAAREAPVDGTLGLLPMYVTLVLAQSKSSSRISATIRCFFCQMTLNLNCFDRVVHKLDRPRALTSNLTSLEPLLLT